MKRHLLILLPVFLFAVVPVFASQDGKEKQKDKENKHNAVIQEIKDVEKVTVTPQSNSTAVPTVICDPNAEWKNHGKYVSCVSHERRSGQAVSEAAHSDIGKKHNKSPKPSVIPSPSVMPSGEPTIIPSIFPSEIPTVSPSAIPSPNPDGTTTIDTAQLQAIITALEGILTFFKNLL